MSFIADFTFASHDVGDEHIDDLVAEAGHVGVELLLHGGGDAGLAGEDLVEHHAGHVSEDHLLHIRLDLLHRVGQLIEGVVHFFRTHSVLHRDRNGDEDVVLGLGFHGQRDLIDAQAHAAGDPIDDRPFPVQPGLGHAQEFSEPGDDGRLRGLHREEAEQGGDGDGDDQRPEQKHARLPNRSGRGFCCRVVRFGAAPGSISARP
jgi:hypothetical protein